MDEFVRELKESAAGLHDGMGGHADYCAELMEKAAKHIAELEENATSQALALKAAKAMQQAETERADANERDAERYRWLLANYARGDGWQEIDDALNDGDADTKLSPSIDQAMRHL